MQKVDGYRFTDSALRPYIVLRAILPFLLSVLRDFRRWFLFGRPRVLTNEQELVRAERLITRIAQLGPTFIKFGQILAMREDFIPRLYTDLLKGLHDKVPTFSVDDVHRIIEDDFGCGIATLFESFESDPLAAASLGQVHRAVYQGQPVVVKVLRPGVEQLVSSDLRVIRFIFSVARAVFGRHFIITNLTSIADEFDRMIYDEMNFEVEAKNADEIRANLKDMSGVCIPRIYHELLSKRVLTMEYIDGIRIDDADGLLAWGHEPMRIMRRLVELYTFMLAHDGVSHADPHPGNLLVDRAGNIVMLDFGMVLRLGTEIRRELVRTISAAARDDVDSMVRGFYKLRMVTPGTNMVTLRDAARVILDITYRTQFSTSRIVQKMVTEILATFYRFPLILPSNLVYLLRIATILEGIGIHYRSDFNGIRFARPIIRRQMLELGISAPKEVLAEANEFWKNGMEFVRGVDRIVAKIDREEMKVGVHPSDMGEIEHYFSGVQRRMIFGMLALAIAVVSAIVFTATLSYLQLFLGEIMAFCMFIALLVLPVYRRWK